MDVIFLTVVNLTQNSQGNEALTWNYDSNSYDFHHDFRRIGSVVKMC